LDEKEAFERLKTLTKTEAKVLELRCEGLKWDQISKQLFVSKSAIFKHVEHIYEKLGLDTISHRTKRDRELYNKF